ncbi:DUF2537 domain-containing protein [Amycolatopsis australiensis]|uniref:DUF2537 domain-containing protein n=1 Tax=Amycolatopsis australiensis TaxID=546364 RepID=A0A1K1QQK1_9PSEU|nr:DUF2537 domain-containing protein [Amycolatopsis australiensis]SFW62168.1 Protein of unknown function [Amycolatopsis australiensis]
MELRIRGERAVLAGPGGEHAREVDPHKLAIGADLAQALHEWARVASAVAAGSGAEAGAVVSQRGRQLAGRLAAVMGTTVRFVDPVTGADTVVEPPPRAGEPGHRFVRAVLGPPGPPGEPTPWLTGLTVSAFIAAVVVVAMLALATTLARETSGWLALVASVVVTAGITPSLWLIRRTPILRWAAYGAAAGVVIAWVGVLVIAF